MQNHAKKKSENSETTMDEHCIYKRGLGLYIPFFYVYLTPHYPD